MIQNFNDSFICVVVINEWYIHLYFCFVNESNGSKWSNLFLCKVKKINGRKIWS